MKKYKVCITETLQKVIEVKANDESEAIDKVHDMYRKEQVVLDDTCYMDTDIDIFLD